jgi:Holliday junction resolvase RusA-like endonuclease
MIVLFVGRIIGTPIPQGSTRAFSRGGKVFTTNDAQGTLARWRGDIRTVVQQRMLHEPDGSPVSVSLLFAFARPKSHLTKGGLAKGAPDLPAPDIDKLTRAVLDALTGIAYFDDRQVADVHAEKKYIVEGPSGLDIVITREGQ